MGVWSQAPHFHILGAFVVDTQPFFVCVS